MKIRSEYGVPAQTTVVPLVPMASAMAETGSHCEETFKAVLVLNAWSPNDGGSCDKKVTEVSPVQFLNAEYLMDVTESGMVTEVSPVQLLNADSPMDVTEFPMITEVSP